MAGNQKDLAKIQAILEANKDRNFVDRILHKDNYPSLDLGNGQYATHLMSYAQVGDKYHVFPMIQFDGQTLTKYYDFVDAYRQADANGDVISFDTEEEADWFTKNYKKVWE